MNYSTGLPRIPRAFLSPLIFDQRRSGQDPIHPKCLDVVAGVPVSEICCKKCNREPNKYININNLGATNMAQIRIDVSNERVAAFCRRHRIRKLAFFGSVLREDFGPDSDVDVLVEFEPGFVPGLEFFALEEELSGILGRKVDLNTPAFLSRYFREQALAEAEVQYVAP